MCLEAVDEGTLESVRDDLLWGQVKDVLLSDTREYLCSVLVGCLLELSGGVFKDGLGQLVTYVLGFRVELSEVGWVC